MNVGIYVCVLLAALSSGSLSLPSQSMSQRAENEALVSDSLPPPSPSHTRHARSAPALTSGQLANYNQPQEDADARNSLSQLLVRLMSRKGEQLNAQPNYCQDGDRVVISSHHTLLTFLLSCLAPGCIIPLFPASILL
uniref:Gastrin/cholecystokinin peptide hormone domain-containing protein n=1 Tax=Monopterus albus TaxID=43700 RepID=A0A3Q3RA49_MONAL